MVSPAGGSTMEAKRQLTDAERARRAAALGLSTPPVAAPPPAPKRLAATPAMYKRIVTDFASIRRKPAEPVAPPPAAEPSKKEQRLAAFKQTRDLLQARYPLIFSWARPLAIGTREQLRAAVSEDDLSTQALNNFLRIWTRRHAYRAALERGDRRINLDGSDAGPAFDRPQAAHEDAA